MSLPVGRVLRNAAGRAPTARILGAVSASVSTTPVHVRARNIAPVTAGFHTVAAVRRQNNKNNQSTQPKATETTPAEEEPAAGLYARTDESITVEYPPDEQLPVSEPVVGAGRAGVNVFPTLATFSLQGKVGVVTGGARGLGLVMGRMLSLSQIHRGH
jgi:hypothetical protein